MTTKRLNIRILKELKLYPINDELINGCVNTPYIKTFIENLRYKTNKIEAIILAIINKEEYYKCVNEKSFIVKINGKEREKFINVLKTYGIVWRSRNPIDDLKGYIDENEVNGIYFCIGTNGLLSWTNNRYWFENLSEKEKRDYILLSLEELDSELNIISKQINNNLSSIIKIDNFKKLKNIL